MQITDFNWRWVENTHVTRITIHNTGHFYSAFNSIYFDLFGNDPANVMANTDSGSSVGK